MTANTTDRLQRETLHHQHVIVGGLNSMNWLSRTINLLHFYVAISWSYRVTKSCYSLFSSEYTIKFL